MQPSLIAIEAAPGAEPCAHWRMVARLGPRRNEEQGEAPRSGAGIDAELDPIGVDERKGAVIGQQVDVEVILTDRRQCEAPLAPREIGFAELDRAWRGCQAAAASSLASASPTSE